MTKTHKWDADGERCVKCGDKDWMNDPVCTPRADKLAPDVEEALEAVEEEISFIGHGFTVKQLETIRTVLQNQSKAVDVEELKIQAHKWWIENKEQFPNRVEILCEYLDHLKEQGVI